ncbi:porin family protein [uncultured Arcticibacterium sp.]|uniref:porin family protein n=1 Tax=uncultured Arcticibacterium sp. TaxID=2173042 RepID=UPI0030F7B60C
MKKLLVLLSLLSFQTAYSMEWTAADTTIISFSDNSLNKRVTVISTGNKEMDIPITFNLERLLTDLGLSKEKTQSILNDIQHEKYQSDTLNVTSPSGQKLQIVGIATQQKFLEEFDDYEDDYIHEDDWDSEDNQNDYPPETSPKFFPRSDFGFYIGLNNYKNASTTVPSQLSKLRPWSSRYVAFSFRKNATLSKSRNLDLAFSYGPEFAIYNLMFKNSNGIINQNGQVTFETLEFETKKSKLTVPYINLPLLLSLGTKKQGFKLSLGGYMGYRIGSHTKTKDLDGNKEKIRDGFNLNRFNYGLTSEIGKKGGLSFFFRYDLRPLFESNQINAKDLQAYSFGIRL